MAEAAAEINVLKEAEKNTAQFRRKRHEIPSLPLKCCFKKMQTTVTVLARKTERCKKLLILPKAVCSVFKTQSVF